MIDHFHQQKNKKLYFVPLFEYELSLKVNYAENIFNGTTRNDVHVHTVHYWIGVYHYAIMPVPCRTAVGLREGREKCVEKIAAHH